QLLQSILIIHPTVTAIYSLSLHDALPICPENHLLSPKGPVERIEWFDMEEIPENLGFDHAQIIGDAHRFLKNNLKDRLIMGELRSEEHTSELQSRENLVCRLLLEKKKMKK